MDNLKCCFFCLKPLPGCDQTQENRTKIRHFFEMVQRHVGDSSLFPFKHAQAANQAKLLVNNEYIFTCSECLNVLTTFNELYDQLKTIELRTNMILAKLGDIMREASKESSKRKRCHHNLQYCLGQKKVTVDQLNWARQGLQLKCSNQLIKQFPRVAVKRSSLEKSENFSKRFRATDFDLDATIKQDFSDDMKPKRYTTIMTLVEHGTTSILVAMASLKIILQLSLFNTTEIWSPSDNEDQLRNQQHGVRNILLLMASLQIVFELALTNAKNVYHAQTKYPTDFAEIPVDDDDNHLCKTGNKFDRASRRCLDKCNTLGNASDRAQSGKVLKSSKDVLECDRCQEMFDNFSSLKDHWLQCDLKKIISSPLRVTTDKLVTNSERKFVRKEKVTDSSSRNKTEERAQCSKTFACDKCPKICNTKQLLKNHQFIHCDESTWPHSCPVCEKRFTVKHHMYFHMMKFHSNDPTTKTKILQLRARKIERNESQQKNQRRFHGKNYTCQKCGKKCQNYQVYNYHVQTHLSPENWNYSCSVCKKRFIAKVNLNSHMRTHSKEKPFPCSKCDRKFAHVRSRSYHMMIWH